MRSHGPLAVDATHALSTSLYLFLLKTTRMSLSGFLSPAINRRSSSFQEDTAGGYFSRRRECQDRATPGAHSERGTVSSGSENCRKIAAKSDILFLSVTTAPCVCSLGMFMGFYRLVSPIVPSHGDVASF